MWGTVLSNRGEAVVSLLRSTEPLDGVGLSGVETTSMVKAGEKSKEQPEPGEANVFEKELTLEPGRLLFLAKILRVISLSRGSWSGTARSGDGHVGASSLGGSASTRIFWR